MKYTYSMALTNAICMAFLSFDKKLNNNAHKADDASTVHRRNTCFKLNFIYSTKRAGPDK